MPTSTKTRGELITKLTTLVDEFCQAARRRQQSANAPPAAPSGSREAGEMDAHS